MRKIYLFTSIAALGAASTQCSSEPTPPNTTSGGAMSGGATSGGATSGGATSGGATSGGATSGGATSGGATSGGAMNGGSAGSSNGGSAGSSNGGAMNGGSAGSSNGGSAGSSNGGSAGGGASGSAGMAGNDKGGSAGAGTGGGGGTSGGGAGGSGGATTVAFADVAKILNANCGMFCHKAGNDKGHIVLSNTDNMLYTRLTTALTTTECKGATLVVANDTSKSLLPMIVAGSVNTMGCNNVPRMPNMCSTTTGSPGGNPPSCLSKGDQQTIQNWITQGAKGP